MKTKFYAVLRVTARQTIKLANLCSRVIEKLTNNSADYTTPNPTIAALTTENDKLITLNGQAKGNTQKKDERDAQAVVVYEMLKDERDYVNGIANGNKVLVDKSGFDADKTPEAHGIPPVPVIKKVTDGAVAHSGKIQLVSPLVAGARYSVQTYVPDSKPTPIPPVPAGGDDEFDIDALPWVMTLESLNSKELLLTGLKRGKDILIRVRAEDGSKKSGWSDPFVFLPR